MKMLRNIGFASVVMLGLTACGGSSTTGPVDPSTPSTSVATVVAQIISATRQACEFQPNAQFIESLVNQLGIQTGNVVEMLTGEICSAVQKVKANKGLAVTVRGVPLRGNLVHRRA